LLPLYAADLGLGVEEERAGEVVMGLQSMRIRLVTGEEERPTEVALRVRDKTDAHEELVLPLDRTFGARIVLHPSS
jgi:hypothetical protein